MIDWRPIRNADGSIDRYAIQGYVGGRHAYTIARVVVRDETRFEARTKGDMACLAVCSCADDARDACTAHYVDATADALTRRSDPSTSHEAAERVIRSGARDDHVTKIIEAVYRHPGKTSAELAQITGLERHEAGRRTADAEHNGYIHKGAKRACDISGRAAMTWWPVMEAAA